MFGAKWTSATGTVISSRVAGASASSEHGGSVRREHVVELVAPDGTTRREVVPDGNYSDFWAPRNGQQVRLEVNDKAGTVRFDRSDPGLSFKEHERRTAAAFDADLTANDQ